MNEKETKRTEELLKILNEKILNEEYKKYPLIPEKRKFNELSAKEVIIIPTKEENIKWENQELEKDSLNIELETLKENGKKQKKINCLCGIHSWIKLGGARNIGKGKFLQLFICENCRKIKKVIR